MVNLFKKYIKYFMIKIKNRKKRVFFKGVSNIAIDSFFEGNNVINKNCTLEKVFIGYGSYLGVNCNFYKTKIGRFCSISSNVKLINGNHPSSKFVSTHPAFYSVMGQAGFSYTSEQLFKENLYYCEEKDVILNIGNDVWIGQAVMIMEGISIGDGAIIASGAIVTKNVEPYTIVGGVPAKEIKKRFSETQISFLLNEKWWEYSNEKLEENYYLFRDIDIFVKKRD
ncbi:CatB-related O-acetyltransferase [Carnobacterium maltaromaticum]|uniref:CatB-related O-acetyltransferase n=1 Tax=Carnobacterium maltaromaticum TaxID=2751 RepID=UPI0039BDC171